MDKKSIILDSLNVEFDRNYLENFEDLQSDRTCADIKGIDEVKNLIICAFNNAEGWPDECADQLKEALMKLGALQNGP